MDAVYPSEGEQLTILAVIKQQYPMPKKYPKPYQSYDHWRVDEWFHRPDALYFHLEYGKHSGYSMPQADYFEWRWHAGKEVWLKVDRETREMTEITKEQFDLTRGSRMNAKGFLEWFKDGKWE